MRIVINQRDPAPGTIVLTLMLSEVERAWAGYKQMAQFVSINPDPGDEDLPLVNAKGFAKYLAMGYGFVGFEVAFVGDDVHVTPPVRRVSPIAIGLSIRKTAE